MWKTTDRYVQQKRVKAVEAESKLKQVYIPNYTKPNPALITNNNTSKSNLLNGTANGNNNDILALTTSGGVKPCESCSSSQAANWYTWGPSHLTCRLCQTCWNYWKKYGGLKTASRLAENDVTIDAASIPQKKRPVDLEEEERGITSAAHRQGSHK
jgi:metastasis-associated protein MTA